MQLDPHQVLNMKAKGRQLQLNSHKKNKWQTEMANVSLTGCNSVTLN